MSDKNLILKELSEAAEVLNRFLSDESNLENISLAADTFIHSFKNGGKAISCGNGGSSCDAMHFAEELTGRYRENRKAIPAISISDQGHITCTGNDYGYEYIFSRYLEALGNEGDVLLAISTSGNSPNVLRAAETAKQRKMKVIALTGKGGGKLAQHSDVLLNVSHEGFADRIQEVHIKIIHILILLIEKGLAK